MTLEIVFVLLLVVAVAVLFASERFRVDLVAVMAMGLLLLSGIVTPEEGIAGFSNTATVTVAAMFVLSAAVFKTGAVNSIAGWTIRAYRKSLWMGIAATMVLSGVLSAFVNNTPIVAIFIPILIGVAREIGQSPSRLLMPLSFASMFGGVCTLIGTSTNILLSSIAVQAGYQAFGMFEFTALGAIFFVIGTVYMMVIGVRLIPQAPAQKDLTGQFGMGEYMTEIELLPEAPSVGQTIKNSRLVAELGLEVLELRREGDRRSMPRSSTILRAGDVLRVAGDIEKMRHVHASEGIRMHARGGFHDADVNSEEVVLVEAIIAPNSRLENRSLVESRFRDQFGVTVLAVLHRGQVVRSRVNRVKLKAGDALLLEVSKDRMQDLREEDAFVFLSDEGIAPFRTSRMGWALAIAVGVVASAAAGVVPIVVSAIVGCILMVLAGCITLEEAYQAIDWKVVVLLAGVLTLGVALEKSGAALLLADQIVATVGPFGPIALVAVFYLLTSVLTELMSNNATAALLAPIALASAAMLSIDPRPLLMAVTFAASASFMTPIGYQTNTMIYSAGKYRFKDFLIVGTPLNLIFWLVATLLIPVFWPF